MNEIYKKNIVKTFKTLKDIDDYKNLINNCIHINSCKGFLIPVCNLHERDTASLLKLADWRRNAVTFHNKFNVTHESTKFWLRNLLLDIPDRILFLVLDEFGTPIGHMGFANALNEEGLMEFDNVIRGLPDLNPGIMGSATLALLNWASASFKPKKFYIRTLESNNHAISFYKKLGFVFEGRQPLRRVETDDEFNHFPIKEGDKNPPDQYFICMKIYPVAIKGE